VRTTHHDQAPPTSLGAIVARHRLGLIGSAVCAVVAAAGSLAPFVAVYAVTVALFSDGGDPGRIPAIAGWTAVAVVLRAVAQGVSTHLGHVAAYRVLADVRRTLARRLQAIPLARVRQRSTGEMKKVLHDDVEQLEEALAHGVPDGAAAAAVPLATTALLLALDWRLALVALGSLVLLVVVSAVGMRLAMRSNEAQARHATVLQGAIMGYLQGIEVIRSFVRADRTAARASRRCWRRSSSRSPRPRGRAGGSSRRCRSRPGARWRCSCRSPDRCSSTATSASPR
jgi:ATP-binding cassette subfamily B protein